MEHAAGPSRESDGTARPQPAGFRRAGVREAGTPLTRGREDGASRRRACVARSRPRSGRASPFAPVEAFYAPSRGIGLPYPASDTAELIDRTSSNLLTLAHFRCQTPTLSRSERAEGGGGSPIR